MNWLLLIIIGVLMFFIWRGKKNGFIKTVFVIFSTIIAILITMIISPYVSKWIKSNDKLTVYINEKVSDNILTDVKEDTNEVNYIESLPLPSLIKDTLIENKEIDGIYDALNVNNFNGYVINVITTFIINVAVFLLVWVLVKIILFMISKALDIIASLPVLKEINELAGAIAGLANGFLIVWIGFLAITMFASSQIGQMLFEQINSSKVLSFLYNNNLILIFLSNVKKVLL